MARKLGRALTTILVALVLLAAIPSAIIFASAWTARWRASRLLTVIRQFRPGTTTEEQAEKALEPFRRFRNDFQSGFAPSTQQSEYDFSNTPPWRYAAFDHALTFLPWTRFSVVISYRDAMLSEMQVREAQQEHLGYVHPVLASAQLRSVRSQERRPEDFNGYEVRRQNTVGLDDLGKPNGFVCCEEEFTILDERASAQQRVQALNFRLACVTSIFSCSQPRKLRPPL